MIPEFDGQGNLPPGIHVASIREIEDRFAIFNRSDRRLQLFQRLLELLAEIHSVAMVKRVLLAGSFITATPEPNDFDCLLILDRQIIHQELRPFEYRVLSRKAARKAFGGDVVAVTEGSELEQSYLEFFQTDRHGRRKGIVEVLL